MLHQPRRRREPELPPPPDIDLDAKCGRYFTYRDLIECGETWHRLAALHREDPEHHPFPDNVPRQLETYAAMRELCEKILDPVRDHFGPITLTYAFASPWLTRHIKRGIAPKLDQHAGFELSGPTPLCLRTGQSADLLLVDQPSTTILPWLRERDFDRIYFYGDSRPLHVSISTDLHHLLIDMRSGVPRPITDRCQLR